MANELDWRQSVQTYYGQTLSGSADLKTGACCDPSAMSPRLRALLADLHPDVLARFYGCGSPVPVAVEGLSVLDLGCGSGRDAYLLSRLVGPQGQVIGVDMTPEQLAVAAQYRDWHAERFGHARSNVSFREGLIEDLSAAGIADESVDLVVSNCVLNLCADKSRAFAEALRVLKPGGELYFSDVFADRRIPTELRSDPVLLGECLGGALYWEDFRRLMQQLGCADVRICARSPVPLLDAEVERRIGMVRFESVTVRAFKLPLEDRCEDYGQMATYLGGLEEAPHAFELDDHHRFELGRPMSVCGNTAAMLSDTRFARWFAVHGNRQTHFGLFDCGPTPTTAPDSAAPCC
ncbi:MAG: methyltransferase domain-containing protein [Xanthomonadales bacterium]|nr:methyltransferase domain-containing protein [Xanthomonadales bacterium]